MDIFLLRPFCCLILFICSPLPSLWSTHHAQSSIYSPIIHGGTEIDMAEGMTEWPIYIDLALWE